MIKNWNALEHYEFYNHLCDSHKWPALPINFLPLVGFVSYQDEKPAALIFVYDTVGTQWAVMEWLFVDYSFSKVQRNDAITECIDAAKGYADYRKLTLFTSCKSAKLVHRYQNAGFTKTDQGMTNFIYRGQ